MHRRYRKNPAKIPPGGVFASTVIPHMHPHSRHPPHALCGGVGFELVSKRSPCLIVGITRKNQRVMMEGGGQHPQKM